MSLTALIRERRSIRKFNDVPVSQGLVFELLEQAERLYDPAEKVSLRYIYAGTPDSRNRLVDYMMEPMTASRLGKLIPDKMLGIFKKRFVDIPAHVIVIAETAADRRRSDQNYADVCSIIQNFQLLGWERRLGMLWDTESIIQNEIFFKRIGIGEGERFVGILHIGYFDKTPKGRARTLAEKKWTVFQG